MFSATMCVTGMSTARSIHDSVDRAFVTDFAGHLGAQFADAVQRGFEPLTGESVGARFVVGPSRRIRCCWYDNMNVARPCAHQVLQLPRQIVAAKCPVGDDETSPRYAPPFETARSYIVAVRI